MKPPELAQLVSPMTPVLGPALGTSTDQLALPPAVETPTGEPVDVDLTETIEEQEAQYFWDRFWADAEVVSVAHMQRIYGKVAARKATDKRSVSLHTLDVIRCLEAHTIANFEKFSAYLFARASAPPFVEFSEEYERVGLTYAAFRDFQEARLMTPSDLIKPFSKLQIGEAVVRVCADDGETEAVTGLAMPKAIALTQAGFDLISLGRQQPDQMQTAAIVAYLAAHGGKRLEWSADGTSPFLPLKAEMNFLARRRTSKPPKKSDPTPVEE